jgi:diacylglycerol kinase family enzyme
MKISLLHNPDAGDGFSLEDVRDEIEGAGHEIVLEIEKGVDFGRAASKGAELIVVAGGDGTVRKAVQALQGTGTPLAILPFGTANNVARSLGVEGPLDELTHRWNRGRRVPFDLGTARGHWGESLFLEGAGVRLMPKFFKAAKKVVQKKKEKEGETVADDELEIARGVFCEVVKDLEPRRISFKADGEEIEGEFLLVEILNTPSNGPALRISPGADVSDGLLDVVVAGEEERDELLAALGGDPKRRPNLPTRRVREVEIPECPAIHVDGDLFSKSESGDVSILVEPAKIEFLV